MNINDLDQVTEEAVVTPLEEQMETQEGDYAEVIETPGDEDEDTVLWEDDDDDYGNDDEDINDKDDDDNDDEDNDDNN